MKRFEPGKRGSEKAERRRRKAYRAVERSRFTMNARSDVFRGVQAAACRERREEAAKELRASLLHIQHGSLGACEVICGEIHATRRAYPISTTPRGWGWPNVTNRTI